MRTHKRVEARDLNQVTLPVALCLIFLTGSFTEAGVR